MGESHLPASLMLIILGGERDLLEKQREHKTDCAKVCMEYANACVQNNEIYMYNETGIQARAVNH